MSYKGHNENSVKSWEFSDLQINVEEKESISVYGNLRRRSESLVQMTVEREVKGKARNIGRKTEFNRID